MLENNPLLGMLASIKLGHKLHADMRADYTFARTCNIYDRNIYVPRYVSWVSSWIKDFGSKLGPIDEADFRATNWQSALYTHGVDMGFDDQCKRLTAHLNAATKVLRSLANSPSRDTVESLRALAIVGWELTRETTDCIGKHRASDPKGLYVRFAEWSGSCTALMPTGCAARFRATPIPGPAAETVQFCHGALAVLVPLLETIAHQIALELPGARQPESIAQPAATAQADEYVTREWIAQQCSIPVDTLRGPKWSKILGKPDKEQSGRPSLWKKSRAIEFIAAHGRP